MNAVIEFLRESKTELFKVNWPTRRQLIRHTAAVIVISFLMAVFLGTLDWVFSSLADRYLFR